MFIKNILNPIINNILNQSDRNAFCINEKFYTYGQFGQKISQIRHALSGVNFESKNIGLTANDDIETYASIFALWLEGLAYVPLHPHQPDERSREIIQQADIEVVLNSENHVYTDSAKHIITTMLTSDTRNIEPSDADDNDLVYILFTSGSTGTPKGVQITRTNIAAFSESFQYTDFGITNKDRCLQCFDLTFDVSVQSFLIPLLNCACVYTIPHDQIKYSYIYGLFEDHKLTFSVLAPSMLRYLKPYFDEIDVPSMRNCILTAEASPVDLIDEWAKCIPNSRVYDFYGPTEATIYCTSYEYKRDCDNKQVNGMLAIGKPLKNLKAIIIDDNESIITESNCKGELCIAGKQLTPGYWKNPERTEKVFLAKSVDNIEYSFYRTGDLCYYDDDGDILYSGRIDHQVKIQGYRIELGEIEYHAREFLKDHNAVAVTKTNSVGNTEIVLFAETDSNIEHEIVSYLKNHLPHYMIPTQYKFMKEFPINTSGKIDRKKLEKEL